MLCYVMLCYAQISEISLEVINKLKQCYMCNLQQHTPRYMSKFLNCFVSPCYILIEL